MNGSLTFALVAILGTLALYAAWRTTRSTRSAPARRQARQRTRPRDRRPPPRAPGGGRSSAPTVMRIKRCAVYEIPSFGKRDAYIGRSTHPHRRVGRDHTKKWWWKYVSPNVKVYPPKNSRDDWRVEGVKITWYPNEFIAHQHEQALIGKRCPWFNREGNNGHGMYGPADPRVLDLQREWLASLRKASA